VSPFTTALLLLDFFYDSEEQAQVRVEVSPPIMEVPQTDRAPETNRGHRVRRRRGYTGFSAAAAREL
jgi:hypothetical protein